VHLRRRGRAEDHASDDSVRTDAGSWWLKTQGERQRRVNQNLRDTCRAPRVTDPYDGEIHATATGLSVDPRSATGPCANITIVAQRLAQTGGRCKALPRCEGDSAPYGIAVDHGYCDRTDISLTLAPQCRRRFPPPSSRRRLHSMANSAAGPALCFRRNGRSWTGRRSKVRRAIHVREIGKRLTCEARVRQQHHCNPAVCSWTGHPHGGCNDGSECWSQNGTCFGTCDGEEWGHWSTNQRTAR
jgi:hypothetical protein